MQWISFILPSSFFITPVQVIKVSAFQPYFITREKAEVLFRRLFHKICSVYPQFPRKRNFSGSPYPGSERCFLSGKSPFGLPGNWLLSLLPGQNYIAALGLLFEIFSDTMLQERYIHRAVRFSHPYSFAESSHCFRSISPAAYAGYGRHPRIVPSLYGTVLYHRLEISLGHDCIGEIEPCKFYLLRRSLPPAHFPKYPVVQRSVVLEFQSAYGMSYALYGIFYRNGQNRT